MTPGSAALRTPPLAETPVLGAGRRRFSALEKPGALGGGNQRELARQKNMKKQSDSVKGKRRDDGLSAAARKQRDSEIMQQKQKKANEKKEEPKSQHRWHSLCPESAAGSFCASFPSGSLSPPGPLLGLSKGIFKSVSSNALSPDKRGFSL
ncbi:hypothetical protein A6R68_18854 [Neotoma lepida]|uniref:Small EDRK-rich factor 2 n=1 Tax=Neotoma lepida TaxID=56216 RepID=A0A1A6HKK4_NEOLE|nr:hypothetical protein A6R68_18854 [Neotoma lepida]